MVSMVDWMSNIADNTRFKDIVMPGAHDAGVWASPNGTNVSVTNFLMPVASIAAQLGDIRDQARSGARWFDIRMFKTPTRWSPLEDSLRPQKMFVQKDNSHGGKTFKNQKMKLRAAHVPSLFQETAMSYGVMQSPGLGGYGASIEQILDQALGFVGQNNSEFIVIRFSHCPEPKKVLKEIKYYIENELKNANRILRRGSPGIAATLGGTHIQDLRGKVALIFESNFNKYMALPEFHPWVFTYNKSGQGPADATCCGTYANSPDINEVKNAATQAAATHLNHGNADGHLCFVYWQLTERSLIQQMTGGGNIQQNTTGATGTHAATPNLVTNLSNAANLFNPVNGPQRVPVNVVSYDFVNDTTSQTIVKINGVQVPGAILNPWPANW